MSDRGLARVEAPEFGKTISRPVGLPAQEDGYEEARVIDLGRSQRIEESRKREDHWTEVDLVLEMWDRVACSWDNDTLIRLARYARLEAETEREQERKAR